MTTFAETRRLTGGKPNYHELLDKIELAKAMAGRTRGKDQYVVRYPSGMYDVMTPTYWRTRKPRPQRVARVTATHPESVEWWGKDLGRWVTVPED